MPTKTINRHTLKQQREASFTLIETVIALSIVVFLMAEVSAVQGNSLVFADYGRNITQATWLARRVLAQVENNWRMKPFKDLMTVTPETEFEDFKEYSYALEIKEWKFPFAKMLQQVLGGEKLGAGEDDKKETAKGQDGGFSGMIDTVVKQIFGDEPIFMIARVEVSWPEGARRGSTSLTYLLTNQAKLDEAIVGMRETYKKLIKPQAKTDPKARRPQAGDPAGAAGAGGAAGPDGTGGAGAAGQGAEGATGAGGAGGAGGSGGIDGGAPN